MNGILPVRRIAIVAAFKMLPFLKKERSYIAME